MTLHRFNDWRHHRQQTSKQRFFRDKLRLAVKGVLTDFSPTSSDGSDEDDVYSDVINDNNTVRQKDGIWKARQAVYTC